jgi:hypothetical protein
MLPRLRRLVCGTRCVALVAASNAPTDRGPFCCLPAAHGAPLCALPPAAKEPRVLSRSIARRLAWQRRRPLVGATRWATRSTRTTTNKTGCSIENAVSNFSGACPEDPESRSWALHNDCALNAAKVSSTAALSRTPKQAGHSRRVPTPPRAGTPSALSVSAIVRTDCPTAHSAWTLASAVCSAMSARRRRPHSWVANRLEPRLCVHHGSS